MKISSKDRTRPGTGAAHPSPGRSNVFGPRGRLPWERLPTEDTAAAIGHSVSHRAGPPTRSRGTAPRGQESGQRLLSDGGRVSEPLGNALHRRVVAPRLREPPVTAVTSAHTRHGPDALPHSSGGREPQLGRQGWVLPDAPADTAPPCISGSSRPPTYPGSRPHTIPAPASVLPLLP